MRRACSSGLHESREPVVRKIWITSTRYFAAIYRTLQTLQHDNEQILTLETASFLTLIVPTAKAPETHLELECLCSFPTERGKKTTFDVLAHFNQFRLQTTPTDLNKLSESKIHLHEDVLPGFTHACKWEVQVLQQGRDMGELACHPGHLRQTVRQQPCVQLEDKK